MNTFFVGETGVQANPHFSELRRDLQTAIQSATKSDSDQAGAKMGLKFDFSSGRKNVVDFSGDAQARFSRHLKSSRGAKEYQSVFFGKSSHGEGLVDNMLSIIEEAEQNLIRANGGIGLFTDQVV